MQLTRSKWFLPLQAVELGIGVFAAQWVGGDPVSGWLAAIGGVTYLIAIVVLRIWA